MAEDTGTIELRENGPSEEVDPSPPPSPSPSRRNSNLRSNRVRGNSNLTAQHPHIVDTAFSIYLRGWLSERGLAVAGWVVAFLSMIVAIVSLLPGFNSQQLSKKALDLAEWTALKDYIEQCKEHLEAGTASSECQDIVTTPLPPPPHVNKDHSYHSRRSMVYQPTNGSSELALASARSSQSLVMLVISSTLIFMSLLAISILLFTSWKYSYKLRSSTVMQRNEGSSSYVPVRTSTHDIYRPSLAIRHSGSDSCYQATAMTNIDTAGINEFSVNNGGIRANAPVSKEQFAELSSAPGAEIGSTGRAERHGLARRNVPSAWMKRSSQNE